MTPLQKYRREYYAANRDKAIDEAKEFYAANRDKIRAQKKEFYAANRDKILAQAKEYRVTNRDKILAQRKEYYSANRDKVLARGREYHAAKRENRMAEKYGVSKEQLALMEEKQGGLCAICGKANRSYRRLCIDHCHTSGKVRGLLCDGCNTGLGAFKDSPELLNRAISYLVL